MPKTPPNQFGNPLFCKASEDMHGQEWEVLSLCPQTLARTRVGRVVSSKNLVSSQTSEDTRQGLFSQGQDCAHVCLVSSNISNDTRRRGGRPVTLHVRQPVREMGSSLSCSRESLRTRASTPLAAARRTVENEPKRASNGSETAELRSNRVGEANGMDFS